MKAVIYTNKGAVREHNEDAIFAAVDIISSSNMEQPLEIEIESDFNNCLAVIDGMGGYKGGEVAARIVAMSFLKNLERLNSINITAKDKITLILNDAVKEISSYNININLSAMGAAVAGVMFNQENILIFNCGDCRVYRVKYNNDYNNKKKLEKLSHDHSVVQKIFDMGKISEDEMRTHKQKNIITACVSANLDDLKIYFHEISREQEQKFFICSDGVWEALSIEEIEECFCENNLETANNLVEKLLKQKCNDNISFIIVIV